VITATDKAGKSSTLSGSFTVGAAIAGPVISSIYVAAASGVMSWNEVDANGVGAATLTVDGLSVTQIGGPYAAGSGFNFSGTFGTLGTGNHTYVITATDKLGNSSTSSGSFNVPVSSAGKSLARGAVMQSLSAGPSASAKIDWLYDVPLSSPLSGTDQNASNDAVDAVLAGY
jgi:hypothetical protein